MLKAAQTWSESEVREVIRLFADTADQPGGVEDREFFLLDGLAKLIGADRWESPGKRGSTLTLIDAGSGEFPMIPESCQEFEWSSEDFCWIAYRFSSNPFTENEKNIARTVIPNVRWLATQPVVALEDSTGRPAAHYPPRLARTLHGLLAGLSRKEIAVEMDVSVHTVSGYVKEVYRLAGVTSHSKLLNQYPSQLGHATKDHS